MTNQAILYKQVSAGQQQCGLELIEMAQPVSGGLVLDIGSGTGNLTFELAKKIGSSGKVYAIEPDVERMKIAKQHQPEKLTNIIWCTEGLEIFKAPKLAMFDLVYSNYVFYWLKHQKLAVRQVYENLVPGGLFAFCCVFDMPQVIRDLCQAIGSDGEKIITSLNFTSKNKWLNYFKDAGFTIKIMNEVSDYEFHDLNEVMLWWEATTHGVFSSNKLSLIALNKLKKIYSGNIHIYKAETLRLLAMK